MTQIVSTQIASGAEMSSMSLSGIQTAAQTLKEAATRFYQQGWMMGTSGNLSVRLSTKEASTLEMLITASGKDKGRLLDNDFLVVNAQGQMMSHPEYQPSSGAKSSAETLLHRQLYQMDPDIQAVYHVHTPTAALLSQYGTEKSGRIRFQGLEMLKGLGYETHDMMVSLPVFENSQDMATLSEMLPDVLDLSVPGFVLKGHGVYAWGNSPFDAFRHVEIWHYLFEYRWQELLYSGKKYDGV
jgi:methylthioribulose-1-phosphate dehydratase